MNGCLLEILRKKDKTLATNVKQQLARFGQVLIETQLTLQLMMDHFSHWALTFSLLQPSPKVKWMEVFQTEMVMMKHLFSTFSSSETVRFSHLACKVNVSLVSSRNQVPVLRSFVQLSCPFAYSLFCLPLPTFLVCLMKALFLKLCPSGAFSSHSHLEGHSFP